MTNFQTAEQTLEQQVVFGRFAAPHQPVTSNQPRFTV